MASIGNAQNQLVVSHPATIGDGENDFNGSHSPNSILGRRTRPSTPSIKQFTVQCAHCHQWRLVPKKNYEEIREHILEQPFLCIAAKEWGPDISCDDPSDVIKDESTIWAMDKPNIPQPPPGWERLLMIRGPGGTKFADVIYVKESPPPRQRFRSMVAIEKHFQENPEQTAGMSISQFSFEAPKPLQQNYLRKRRAPSVSQEGTGSGIPEDLVPLEVDPISYAVPDGNEKVNHSN